MAISRKTFNTVKDILKELDERRSAARPETSSGDASRVRAVARRSEPRTDERRDDDSGPRGGVSDQLIG